MRPTIETASGLFFDYSAPTPEMVDVRDIARSLALTCRFGGHTDIDRPPIFCSVAEHAVLVRDIVRAWGRPDLGYFALHHDDEEAYLGDIPRPLKPFLGDSLEELRVVVELALRDALDLPYLTPEDRELIHRADNAALRLEAAYVKHSRGEHTEWGAWGLQEPPAGLGFAGLSPAQAERDFLYAHQFETGQIPADPIPLRKEAS